MFFSIRSVPTKWGWAMLRVSVATTAALFSIVLGQAAVAADMPVKAPAAIVAPYNWSGIYLGGHAGWGWGSSNTVLDAIPSIGVAAGTPLSSINPSGFMGGGQIGFNWQMNSIVLGVEGSFSGADLSDSVSCTVAGSTFTCPTKINWLATATGRIGVVVNQRLLGYVKGGAAWEHAKYSLSDPLGTVFTAGSTFSSTDTRLGWLIGVGAEYAFADHWSAFVEYNYMDFGTAAESSFLPAPVAAVVTGNITDRLNVVKGGVNFKF
jgi:outer membrane immunogenic protein